MPITASINRHSATKNQSETAAPHHGAPLTVARSKTVPRQLSLTGQILSHCVQRLNRHL